MIYSRSHRAAILQNDAPEQLLRLFQSGLQALPAHVALIDANGEILLVNDAWSAFARENGGSAEVSLAVGFNYLDICRKAQDDPYARSALEGIEDVLKGRKGSFSLEYPCHSETERRYYVMKVAPLDDARGGAVILHQDFTEQRQTERALVEAAARFETIFDHSAVGIGELAAEGGWRRANDELLTISGYRLQELLNKSLLEVTHPDDADCDRTNMEVLRSGAANSCVVEKRLIRKDGEPVWVRQTMSVVRTEGQVVCFVALVEDISARRASDDRREAMLNELSHRGKNLLTVIRALAKRSLTDGKTLAQGRRAFDGRLTALLNTYDAFTGQSIGGSSLRSVLSNELAAFGARATCTGPQMRLNAKAVQTFALIIHELATNAMKYGALSTPQGRVSVVWSLSEDGRRFLFEWREIGGPPPVAPKKKGYGSVLIEQLAAAEFGCNPSTDYSAAGFRYAFDAPTSRIGVVARDTPMRRRMHDETVIALYDEWEQRRLDGNKMPQLGDFDWSHFAASGALTMALVNGEQLHFAQIGRMLARRLGRELTAEELAGESASSLASAYLHCAKKGEPSHEYLKIDFGDGDPVIFERLLAPFCSSPSGAATHVVGIAVFSGLEAPAAPQ